MLFPHLTQFTHLQIFSEGNKISSFILLGGKLHNACNLKSPSGAYEVEVFCEKVEEHSRAEPLVTCDAELHPS